MEMGPCAATGTPHFSYYLTPLDAFAHFDQKTGIVPVAGGVSITMIDLDSLAQAPVHGGEGNDTVGSGVHRRTKIGSYVNTFVHFTLVGERRTTVSEPG